MEFFIWRAHHSEGFATACLPIGKAGNFDSFKRLQYEWLDDFSIEHFVGGVFIEYVVEDEVVLFDIAGEIDLLPGECVT